MSIRSSACEAQSSNVATSEFQMKVILRDSSTDLYLVGPNMWTNDRAKALEFERVEHALEQARRAGVKDLEFRLERTPQAKARSIFIGHAIPYSTAACSLDCSRRPVVLPIRPCTSQPGPKRSNSSRRCTADLQRASRRRICVPRARCSNRCHLSPLNWQREAIRQGDARRDAVRC